MSRKDQADYPPSEILNPPSILAPFEPAITPPRVFDTCKAGMVLRTVLAVEMAVATLALYQTTSMKHWLVQAGVISVGALPAALLWLLLVCMFKARLERMRPLWQIATGMVLGALCGLLACLLLSWLLQLHLHYMLASALAGAQAAAIMMVYLIWRAAAFTPAATAAQLTELQARIRPHFLFNTLNSAIALIRSEPAKAERVLEDLSELFRAALARKEQTVMLKDEVALARHYLAIEQVRFEDRLRVSWDIDPSVGRAELPALVLQPLIENAVKHGVEPSVAGADITITTRKRGDRVHIRVANTMPAGQGEKGHGIALKNVRDRLVLLHDVQCDFRAGIKRTDRGDEYQVRIEVPLP